MPGRKRRWSFPADLWVGTVIVVVTVILIGLLEGGRGDVVEDGVGM